MDPFLDDAPSAKSGFDLGMMWRSFWRRKLLFFVPFLLCVSMAGVVIKTMTPIYESSGLIEIRMDHSRSQLIADPSQAYGQQRDFERRLQNDMVNLLTSPTFLGEVATELGMVKPLRAESSAGGRDLDEAAAINRAALYLRGKISLTRINSTIYRVTVRDEDPREAHRIAGFTTGHFVVQYRMVRLSARNSTREFLESQRARFREDQTDAEARLNAFLADMAASDLVGSRIHAGNIASTEEKLVRVQARHEGADANEFDDLARAARRILNADPPVSIYSRDAILKSLLLELEDLGNELATTPESDSDYALLETRLGRLRVQVSNRVEEMVAANHPNVGVMDRNRLVNYYYTYLYRSVELAVLRQVQTNIVEYRRFITQRPIQSAELAELENEVTSARELVTSIQEEITRQQMNFEAGMSDVGMQITVRQEPMLQPAPVEPNVPKLWFMGFALSFALGSGLVVLAILFDKSFRTVDEIEQLLGVKVIGTLPLIQDEHFMRKRRLRWFRWATIIAAILAVAAVAFLVVYPMLTG